MAVTLDHGYPIHVSTCRVCRVQLRVAGITVLTAENIKLEMIANVNRDVNRDILELTKGIKDVFESLEKVAEPRCS